VVAAPPLRTMSIKPAPSSGVVTRTVVDSGTPAAAPAADPLHLDAGFLFRERK